MRYLTRWTGNELKYFTLNQFFLRWANRECQRRGVRNSGDNKRMVLNDAVYLIRYLSLSAAEFAAGPAQSGGLKL